MISNGLIQAALSEVSIDNQGPFARLLRLLGGGGGSGPLYTVIQVPAAVPAYQATTSKTTHKIFVVDVSSGNRDVLVPVAPTAGDTFTLKASNTSSLGTGRLRLMGGGATIDGQSQITVSNQLGVATTPPGDGTQGGMTFTYDGTEWKIVWVATPTNSPPP